jgi:20S proteasome alpha/beta subunit
VKCIDPFYIALLTLVVLASYGSLAEFTDIQRLQLVGSHTVVGAEGDIPDFQYIETLTGALVIEEFTAQDGHTLGPAEIHEYLARESGDKMWLHLPWRPRLSRLDRTLGHAD